MELLARTLGDLLFLALWQACDVLLAQTQQAQQATGHDSA